MNVKMRLAKLRIVQFVLHKDLISAINALLALNWLKK